MGYDTQESLPKFYGDEGTKAGLVRRIAETRWRWSAKCRLSALSRAEIRELLDVVFDLMVRDLHKVRRFSYPGFGTFTIRTRKARMGVNPQTKRPMKIAACRVIGFKAAPRAKRGL